MHHAGTLGAAPVPAALFRNRTRDVDGRIVSNPLSEDDKKAAQAEKLARGEE